MLAEADRQRAFARAAAVSIAVCPAVLKWSGATAERVDIFRNGKKLSNVANIGMYIDKDLKALAKTARYRLCEDTACSSAVKLEY